MANKGTTDASSSLTTMDGIFIRQANVDADGKLNEFMPATPIGMRCEHKNCKNEVGKDYIRLPEEDEEGWEGEPIFLCDEHSKGHTLFSSVAG